MPGDGEPIELRDPIWFLFRQQYKGFERQGPGLCASARFCSRWICSVKVDKQWPLAMALSGQDKPGMNSFRSYVAIRAVH